MYFCIRNPLIAGNKTNANKDLKSGAPGRGLQRTESEKRVGTDPEVLYRASRTGRLGSLAACKFYEGDLVAATLRFSTHEHQGQVFQDIVATDIVKISK